MKFLDLGSHPPADDFLTEEGLKKEETRYPLQVYICDNCSLVQLGYVVSPQILYQRDYPYVSSTTNTGKKHFHSFAEESLEICRELGLSSRNRASLGLVVDIGSNVGVLLEGFKKKDMQVLGVDPAPNICKIANERGIPTFNAFFNEDTARRIKDEKGKARIITGTNVVAHINDLHALVRAVDDLMEEGGVFIFEAPYLVDLIDNLEYDTIYHEHLSYLSVKPLMRLFDKFNMQIFNIIKKDIHGGSLRYFVSRKKDYKISESVTQFMALEEQSKIYEPATLKRFAENVENNRRELLVLLQSLKGNKKRVAGVGAPAKGMTLLNYCKIGPETLDFITEKSDLKIGRFTPGMHIPVVPDSKLMEKKPDYAFLLAWNFADEIMQNLKEYTNSGGRFIIPIPKPRIVG